jgi:hypothetical protein
MRDYASSHLQYGVLKDAEGSFVTIYAVSVSSSGRSCDCCYFWMFSNLSDDRSTASSKTVPPLNAM